MVFEGADYSRLSHVAVVETSGNQRYIFSSNRRAENVGASFLVSDVTKGEFERSLAHTVIPVVASSGLLVFGSDSEAPLRAAIQHLTSYAWEVAPGLQVAGAWAGDDRPPDLAQDAERLLHDAFEALRVERATLKPASTRMSMIPLTQPCESGNGPATRLERSNNERRFLGEVALAKRRSSRAGWVAVKGRLSEVSLAYGSKELEEALESKRWQAVLHADGDGIGAIIQDFVRHQNLTSKPATDFWETYARFSASLERVTLAAVESAAGLLGDDSRSLLPIVLGGDDVTAVLPGKHALTFAEALMEAFRTGAANEATLQGLTMSAGVAITKPHFPSHVALAIAEELTKGAKRVGAEHLDFHIVYDASPPDLAAIREKLEIETPSGAKRKLTARPFSVEGLTQVRDLKGRLEPLSGSLRHRLREALLLSDDPKIDFRNASAVDEGTPSYEATLAASEPGVEGSKERSMFLDALDVFELEGDE